MGCFMMPWQQQHSSRGASWIGTQMCIGRRREGAFPECYTRCSWMGRQSTTGAAECSHSTLPDRHHQQQKPRSDADVAGMLPYALIVLLLTMQLMYTL